MPSAVTTLVLLLLLNVSTLVLTVLPATTTGHRFRTHVFSWMSPTGIAFDVPTVFYAVDDILRLLEPIINTPLYILVFVNSGVLSVHTLPVFRSLFSGLSSSWWRLLHRRRTTSQKDFQMNAASAAIVQGAGFPYAAEQTFLLVLFGFSLALYNQGAGFHSASTMFKGPMKELYEAFTQTRGFGYVALMDSNDYSFLIQVLGTMVDWTRNTWEHLIAHYWYAVGGLVLGLCNVIAYDSVVFAEDNNVRFDPPGPAPLDIISNSRNSTINNNYNNNNNNGYNTTTHTTYVGNTTTTTTENSYSYSYNGDHSAAHLVPNDETRIVDVHNTRLASGSKVFLLRVLFYLNSAVYGTILGLIGIEFPGGPAALFTICLAYGMFVLGFLFIALKTRRHVYDEETNYSSSFIWSTAFGQLWYLHRGYPGRYMVTKTYFLGFFIALIIIVVWIIVKGGFHSRASEFI